MDKICIPGITTALTIGMAALWPQGEPEKPAQALDETGHPG